MTDCELKSANNKIDELEYKLDNYNNYDPKKLAELRNKTVVIPSNIDDHQIIIIYLFAQQNQIPITGQKIKRNSNLSKSKSNFK
jgi:hypothetical protein